MRLRGTGLTPDEIQDFQAAILDVYDDRQSLATALYTQLGKRLEHITTADGLNNIVPNVIRDAESNDWTAELLQGLRASRPRSQALWDLVQKFGLAPVSEPTGALERKISSQDSMWDVETWRQRLFEAEGQVCRVEIASERGMIYGTGFLVGRNVVMTNYHVVEEVIKKQIAPEKVRLRFDFKKTKDGTIINRGKVYGLATEVWPVIDSSPYGKADAEPDAGHAEPSPDELDYALLQTQEAVGDDRITVADSIQATGQLPQRGWVRAPSLPREVALGSLVFILQHPDEAPLKLAVPPGEIAGFNNARTRVRYTTYTEPGSSGSPCFDASWNLVALHHSGDPRYPRFCKPEYNQGIPISAILALLAKHGKLEALSSRDVSLPARPAPGPGESRVSRLVTYDVLGQGAAPKPAGGDAPAAKVPAARGLELLSQFISQPDVLAVVVRYRDDFEAASVQVDALRDYKGVHDALHDLQVYCYNPLRSQMPLPDLVDPGETVDLTEKLQQIVGRLQEVAARNTAAGREMDWIGDLEKATEKSGEGRLRDVHHRIKRIVTIYPVVFNVRLNDAAKFMRLDRVTEAMDSISRLLRPTGFDPDLVEQFVGGVESLGVLKGRLSDLILEHNRWQAADMDLRRIEESLAQNLDDLIDSWPGLHEAVCLLCQDDTQRWVKELRDSDARLQQAVNAETRDPKAARDRFAEYRRAAGWRFYEVDKKLKKFSEDLLSIGGPLGILLRSLDHG